MTDERFVKARESAMRFRLADTIPEAFAHAAELANEADAIFAEIDRLRERIEQLEYMKARSAAEAKAERERAEFWKGETEKRAEFLRFCERGGSDTFGGGVCPECGQAIGHDADCPMPRMMTMPKEPKP